jgi:hypothetical protein
MKTITEADIKRTRADTAEHVEKVRHAMEQIRQMLYLRANAHDASKFREPEASGFAALQANLSNITYGTPEYRQALAEAQPVISHHYAHNTHHPEHYPDGVAGMSLLDVVEMFCDWYAAGQRTKDGSLARSLAVNVERFKVEPQLAAIFENTRREMGWD